MTISSVTAGHTFTGNISGGTVVEVFSGGVTSAAVVLTGGSEIVLSSGLASITTVSSGGALTVSSGGTATVTTISFGGTEIVSAGGSAEFTTISYGGVQSVSAGGSAQSATVSFGGAEFVGGGSAQFATVSFGGFQLVSSGLAELTTVTGGIQTIISTGSALSTTVTAGGTQTVLSGGVVSVTTLSDALQSVDGGGTAIATSVGNAGLEYVSSGGTAIATTVGSGGIEYVFSGGSANDTTVEGGGYQYLSAATASDTTVDSGAFQYVSGGVANDTTVEGGGRQFVYSTISFGVGSAVSATVDGSQYVDGGTAADATVDNGGSEVISSGGTAIDTTLNSGGSEIISSGGSATGTDLLSGGVIDVTDLPFAAGGSANFNSGSDVLTVSIGGETYSQTLTGNYTGEFFHLASDGSGGTEIFVNNVPCFCAGTRILTETGERPVETLAIGDRVVTRAGALRAIKWIGRRSYDGRFIAGNAEVLPIIVKAGALADGVPRRDLCLSPHHALYLDGTLVPVEHLLNGVSIAQFEAVERVDYFHIELDSHDVILADGAAAESFVDCDSRQMFHNAAQFAQLYPGAGPARWAFCAPRAEDGAELAALWQRLAERAGIEPSAGALLGHLDEAGPACVRGWARDAAHSHVPVVLEIIIDGAVVGQVLANRYRADLAAAGYDHGRHGFAFALARGGGDVIAVRRACDGAELAHSPRMLAPRARG